MKTLVHAFNAFIGHFTGYFQRENKNVPFHNCLLGAHLRPRRICAMQIALHYYYYNINITPAIDRWPNQCCRCSNTIAANFSRRRPTLHDCRKNIFQCVLTFTYDSSQLINVLQPSRPPKRTTRTCKQYAAHELRTKVVQANCRLAPLTDVTLFVGLVQTKSTILL